MKVTIPRPIQTDTRIYGIGIRQFIYLGAGLALAFLVAVLIPAGGIVRLFVGGLIFFAALALAFMKIKGHYLDGHLSNFMRYMLSPRTRVWSKEDNQIQFVYEDVQFNEPTHKAKIISFEFRKEESIPASLAIAAVNLMVILILGSVFYYMMYEGGFRDIQNWLNRGAY